MRAREEAKQIYQQAKEEADRIIKEMNKEAKNVANKQKLTEQRSQ